LKDNRSEFINTNKNNILLDAYNANPTSMSIGILNFIESSKFLKYKNTLFILGDMLELGEKEVEYHQEIVDLLEKNKIKECILVGERFNHTNCKFNYKKAISIKQCITLLSQSDIKEKSIFIKGSRQLTLEKIIQFL
jgi:UDP-N-acetylmuramoyl-tripeptide--D-alanyl-D-alanine ligase